MCVPDGASMMKSRVTIRAFALAALMVQAAAHAQVGPNGPPSRAQQLQQENTDRFNERARAANAPSRAQELQSENSRLFNERREQADRPSALRPQQAAPDEARARPEHRRHHHRPREGSAQPRGRD